MPTVNFFYYCQCLLPFSPHRRTSAGISSYGVNPHEVHNSLQMFDLKLFDYLMSVFGKGICAGHHGSCPLLQLAQLLASFIQCYPGTCQFADDPRSCPLHALDAARARDVLGQTSGCLASGYLAN